ncbi:MAG: isochorismatase family protein [Acidobacteriota bacterium]
MKKVLCGWIAATLLVAVGWAGAAEAEKAAQKRMKPALLVIDVQNAYLPYMDDEDKRFSTEIINGAIAHFRENGFPVIRVYNTDPKWGPKPDSTEFQFPESILVKADDPKVVKNYASAFKQTDLDKILKEKGCNTVFLCGLSAVGCVLATYHGAMDLDYDVFMIKHGLLSHNADYTNVIEDICDAVPYSAMKVMLENARK